MEDALSVVLEEVNFHDQYTARNKIHGSANTTFKPLLPAIQGQGFRFANPLPISQPPKFMFGNQPVAAPYKMPTLAQGQQQGFGYRPQLGYCPPQFGYRPPPLGYRPPQPSKILFFLRSSKENKLRPRNGIQ